MLLHELKLNVSKTKGADVAQAVAKVKEDAKEKILKVNLIDYRTIPHEVSAKYNAAEVLVKPVSRGHGLRAGGVVRFVLALAGVKDAMAKCLGRTPNKLTDALAAIEALKKLKP
jgi:small subunit ribosomal protein S5